jgi:K+ transporter
MVTWIVDKTVAAFRELLSLVGALTVLVVASMFLMAHIQKDSYVEEKEQYRVPSPDGIFEAVLVKQGYLDFDSVPGFNVYILPKGMKLSDRRKLNGTWFSSSKKSLYRVKITRGVIKWEDNNTIVVARHDDDPIFSFDPVCNFSYEGLKRSFLVKYVIVDGKCERNLY